MLLYGITPVPLAEELRASDPELISLLYADDAVFDGLARRCAQFLNMLMTTLVDARNGFNELIRL